MRAVLAFYDKQVLPDGAIVEMKIWRVSSLFCGYPGNRLVGYDNEPGKGDHRHCEDEEVTYTFSTVEKLMADFWRTCAACEVKHE